MRWIIADIGFLLIGGAYFISTYIKIHECIATSKWSCLMGNVIWIIWYHLSALSISHTLFVISEFIIKSYRRRRIPVNQASEVSLFVLSWVDPIGLKLNLGWVWNWGQNHIEQICRRRNACLVSLLRGNWPFFLLAGHWPIARQSFISSYRSENVGIEAANFAPLALILQQKKEI